MIAMFMNAGRPRKKPIPLPAKFPANVNDLNITSSI
jgi:hypothetical protein